MRSSDDVERLLLQPTVWEICTVHYEVQISKTSCFFFCHSEIPFSPSPFFLSIGCFHVRYYRHDQFQPSFHPLWNQECHGTHVR
jgi:hypothetical protein